MFHLTIEAETRNMNVCEGGGLLCRRIASLQFPDCDCPSFFSCVSLDGRDLFSPSLPSNLELSEAIPVAQKHGHRDSR